MFKKVFKSDSKKAKFGSFFLLLSIILVANFIYLDFFVAQKESEKEMLKRLGEVTGNEAIRDSGFLNTSGGRVMGEETVDTTGDRAFLKSENFEINQINFGGGSASLDNSNKPLSIDNVRSESFIDKNKNVANLLVTWSTSTPSSSQIKYQKNGGMDSKTYNENNLNYDHAVFLTNLDQKTAYVYEITSMDKWGNTLASNLYAAYTSSKEASVIDLVRKASGDVFGWMGNVGK